MEIPPFRWLLRWYDVGLVISSRFRPLTWVFQAKPSGAGELLITSSVAAAQADVFQKNSDNKLNKIDKNMKIKR